MDVTVATWLFIGIIFGAMIVLAFSLGRRLSVVGRDGHGIDPGEDRRRNDAVAADAARMADARTPPFQGG